MDIVDLLVVKLCSKQYCIFVVDILYVKYDKLIGKGEHFVGKIHAAAIVEFSPRSRSDCVVVDVD